MKTNYSELKQFKHDIKSPIAALRTLTKLRSTWNASEQTVLKLAFERIENLIVNLENEETYKSCRPFTLAKDLLKEKRILIKGKSISLKLNFEREARYAICNIQPSEFKRILSNLVNNSLESIDDRGFVVLKGVLKNDKLFISVLDNGHGILSDDLSNVTKLGWTQGKSSGQGLGLYHAKETLSKWSGKLHINSIFNLGTKITLALPTKPTQLAIAV
ncbi:hypothetical protein A9Q84_05610 [Halobacteriovorax marinus]|uniref:histidine kinase n=1 Tax=Halobacteriovorax marinus TaxID=97084 RepID=A0A1Y5FB29_9BACT|nr:hypothetical protein A9Q84_05610 [Halobacteriovorax marinus]